MPVTDVFKALGLSLFERRPPLPLSTIAGTVRHSNTFSRLWIRTKCCSHLLDHGGCIPCDYWAGQPVAPAKQIATITKELETLAEHPPRLLLLNTNGSFFDEQELDRPLRQEILRKIRTVLPDTLLIIESRIDHIDIYTIEDLRRISPDKVLIEFGLEASSPHIRQYCCNKMLSQSSILNGLQQLHAGGIKTLANVLVGLPFLRPAEIINHAVKTIAWVRRHKVEGCVLFPLYIKPYTILAWLKDNGFYQPVSLWCLVEVLNQLDPTTLGSIELSWFPGQEQLENPDYDKRAIVPTTCPNCHEQVSALLTKFDAHASLRPSIVRELAAMSCACKTIWLKDMERSPALPPSFLHRHLEETHEKIRELFAQQRQRLQQDARSF